MFTRRAALRLGTLAAVAPLVAACTEEPSAPPPPDPLADLAAKARADAALAEAIATAQPALAAAAGEIAKARTEHATALQAEVDRERPPASSSSTRPPSAPDVPSDAVAALADALTTAEKQAADLVPSVSRYRAGLLGSVAACCASLRVVLS
ncbi:hypothetical protein [Actinophytocola glycyrrhizae]|uniref:Uncharacterized protein n=1 Tax=Actinophytocola glycyrrhizae TaxID=2044873 RepID=A0ABV9S7Z1_9PSEU